MKVFLSGIQLQPLTLGEFPGGELNVRVPENVHGLRGQNCTISVQMTQPEDLMMLVLLKDAIEREYSPRHWTLSMLYVPYARQDRVCNAGESLAIKVFCEMINCLQFDKVLIADPHSDVAPALLNNVKIIEQHEVWDKLRIESNSCMMIPDAGAAKKALKVAKTLGFDEVYQAEKIRNIKTGKIEKTTIHGMPTMMDKTVYIFDDIVDGGWTFTQLAQKVKAQNVRCEVILCVTHGIFSKGYNELLTNGIDEIYTTDSLPQEDVPANVNVINL